MKLTVKSEGFAGLEDALVELEQLTGAPRPARTRFAAA